MVSNDCLLLYNCLLLNDRIWLNGRLWLNDWIWLNDHLRDIASLLNIISILYIDNRWEDKAELHLWRIHDWILLRGTRRNRNRVCIDYFLTNDNRKGYLLIQHRNLFTAPEDVLIYGMEEA